jgi:hypothetical protein
MRRFLILLAALTSTPALAAEPVSPEAAVSTAASTTSVADQIDAYLRTSPALDVADDTPPGVVRSDDRRPHGEISVGVGTGGYRSVYARTDLPVGETGRVSIAIEDTRFSGRRGHRGGAGRSLDARMALGGSSPTDRQRCDLEGMTPPRPLDAIGGPHDRCRGGAFGR